MADPVDPQMQPPPTFRIETVQDELSNPRFSISRFKSRLAQKGGLSRGQYFKVHIVANVALTNARNERRSALVGEGTFAEREQLLNLSGDEINDAPGMPLIGEEELLTCRATSVPQFSVQTTEFAYFTRTLKRPSSRTFEPFTATFLHTNDPGLRQGFERWVDSFNLAESNQSVDAIPLATIVLVHYDMGGRSWLSFLNALRQGLFREDRVIGWYRLIDAYPTAVSGLQFSHDAGEDIQTYDVTFDYQYMTTRPDPEAL